VVIWTAVIAGVVGRAFPAAPIAGTAVGAGICLAATAALATASLAWASDQGRAFDEAIRVSFYLGLFCLAVCTASRAGRGQWRAGLTLGLGIVSVLGLIGYLQPALLLGGGNEVQNAAGRLSEPLGYWNGMAALMAVCTVLLVDGSVAAPGRTLRAAATAALPLALLGIWLTSSRGGAAAAIVGVTVLVAGSPDRLRRLLFVAIGAIGAAVLILASEQMDALTSGMVDAASRSDGNRLSVLALIVCLLTGGVAWLLDGSRPGLRIPRSARVALVALAVVGITSAIAAADPAERFREFKEPPPPTGGLISEGAVGGFSSSGRWQYWSEAVDAFESSPITGIGAGGYEDWWARNAPVAVFVRNPHSLPLQQAAELGAPGLVLFLGFVGLVGVAALRSLAERFEGDAGALVAVFIAGGLSATIDWTWEIPAAFAAVVIAAALLTSSAPVRKPARNPYWRGVATVIVAWIAMVGGSLIVLAELELRRSRAAAADNRVERGIDAALAARTVEPWSAEPYTQLALLEEVRGNYEQALVRLRQAENRDSEDWRLPLIEARLQRKRGDELASRMALERARSLGPRIPVFREPRSDQG
jgi:hypothetical protein